MLRGGVLDKHDSCESGPTPAFVFARAFAAGGGERRVANGIGQFAPRDRPRWGFLVVWETAAVVHRLFALVVARIPTATPDVTHQRSGVLAP